MQDLHKSTTWKIIIFIYYLENGHNRSMHAYLIDNKCLTSHQSGNKKAHSTETVNIQLMDNVLEAMDKKQITVLVLLDISKAFDSIDHARLLYKLSIVGALPSIVNWFKGYLSSRYQYVRIGSTHSDTSPITHGVHQGQILSPLLFCIYLNDLPLRHLALITWNHTLTIRSYSGLFP